jgi:hypothetical protein
VNDVAACEGEFTVRHKLGLHARPAGRFVALASRFQALIEVTRVGEPGESVNGRSVLSLLSKRHGLPAWPDPSQWGEWNGERPYPTIIEHTRDRR